MITFRLNMDNTELKNHENQPRELDSIYSLLEFAASPIPSIKIVIAIGV